MTHAQPGRYQRAIFDSVRTTHDIQYGSADFYDPNLNHDLDPLYLDLYEPVGDSATKRPLVITLFGGAFLGGHKQWDDMVAWCDSLTLYGYVCASIQYRLLFNPLNQESIIRASYRAVQDTRAAIRFLKEMAASYRIDTTRIFLIGNSAGAITSLLTAFITSESERPSSTYGSGSGSDADDLGCLDCSGNSYTHSVNLAGIISLWGGMWSLDWIDRHETTPVLLIHGTADGTVPFDSGYAFGTTLSPFVYGSAAIHRKLEEFAIPHAFQPFDSLGHNFYMDNRGFSFPNIYWEPVFTLGHQFLYHIMNSMLPATSKQVYPAHFHIRPNPVSNMLIISPPEHIDAYFIDLFSLQGNRITTRLCMKEETIDLGMLPKGMYTLGIQTHRFHQFIKLVVH